MVPTAILVKEAGTGRFILTNRTYEAYVGMPAAELIGGAPSLDQWSSRQNL
jgi:hypothetical protein